MCYDDWSFVDDDDHTLCPSRTMMMVIMEMNLAGNFALQPTKSMFYISFENAVPFILSMQ